MKTTVVHYKDNLMKDLADPHEATEYLNAALEEGTVEGFLLALRDVAEAKGMSNLSRKSHLNRVSMYRMLSRHGNPQLSSLTSVLNTIGLRLAVTVK